MSDILIQAGVDEVKQSLVNIMYSPIFMESSK